MLVEGCGGGVAGHGVADQSLRPEIQDDREVHSAPGGGDARDVTSPDGVGSVGREVAARQIRRRNANPCGAASGAAPAALMGPGDTSQPDQALDAPVVHVPAPAAQLGGHPR